MDKEAVQNNTHNNAQKLQLELNNLTRNEVLNLLLSTDTNLNTSLNNSQQTKLSKQLLQSLEKLKTNSNDQHVEATSEQSTSTEILSDQSGLVKYELFLDPQQLQDDKWAQYVQLENRIGFLEGLIGIHTPPSKVLFLFNTSIILSQKLPEYFECRNNSF